MRHIETTRQSAWQIVWFKRDLRIIDHEALSRASLHGPVLPLYILEPDLWQQPDMSYRHYLFLCQSLHSLSEDLAKLGQKLIIKTGRAIDIFEDLRNRYPVGAVWSHQECWNGWTYQRDKQIRQWSRCHQIPWIEPCQHGVIRGLKDRDGWATCWYQQMQQPLFQPPTHLVPLDEFSAPLPTAKSLGLVDPNYRFPVMGGRPAGELVLHSFLYDRGEAYSRAMSSPVTAYDSCSRLSPHLAFGTLSMREVFQATSQRQQQIKDMPPSVRGKWLGSLRAFAGRLRWHCHFIQKLEDEPQIEFKNMHPAYDLLRQAPINQAYLTAWQQGQTGYPMVDACMRALTATGWLNFRMRAMLMSFASYHLWLDWRQPALHLARLFTDYEPGIHYSQVQMQSGTTGINAIRIYNPIKQGTDHDPDGLFIRHWVPELHQMPLANLHTPWQQPDKIGSYPLPIIEEKLARKQAADQLYGLRRDDTHKQTAKHIVQKHGSRKSGLRPKATGAKIKKNRTKQKAQESVQGELPL